MAQPSQKGISLANLAAKAISSRGHERFPSLKGEPSLWEQLSGVQGPTLSPRGINTIIVFPGSFNAPHKGHRDLLEHVMRNAGEDLNVRAAIIAPTNDERLARKMKNDPQAPLLSKAQRVLLLRMSGMGEGHCWACSGSQSDLGDLIAALKAEFQEQDIRVQWVMLAGPENFGENGVPKPLFWACPHVIASNVSRPCEAATDGSLHLKDVWGFAEWNRVEFDEARLFKQVKTKAQMRGVRADSSEMQAVVEAAVTNMSRLRQTRPHRTPINKGTGFIRFVFAQDLSNGRPDAPSSSRIRELLKKITAGDRSDEVVGELGSMSLCTDTLVSYIKTYQVNPELRKIEELAREKATKQLEVEW
ncbi:uncharacterized protein F5Z01DRAFT_697348 [Emericellopsis atlantica]|uniref:Cytidyltransferase-like domain-containing protein n=1 Tax=Emericellopsis atlantica TaxID=2614577 RepID=A0A9P7ZRY8_9HYPO|nr:uncharacterized protein F5Z01DRAFT_697348 [Emericellopsis atlantica]KAG9256595.1 hypothetical protein F5Z01DRAFT_697348 [Emericellopsis atlantica]